MLGVIGFTVSNSSSLDYLGLLYTTLVWSKLECESVVWYNFTLVGSNKLENIKESLQIDFCSPIYLPIVNQFWTV
jgi:hypothetical protein